MFNSTDSKNQRLKLISCAMGFFNHSYLTCLVSHIIKHEKRKETFSLTTHSTFYLQLYSVGYGNGRKEMFYLMTHSTHFIYVYMASDIWLRTILIVREETRCRNMGYSLRLTARVLLYAPSHRQDSPYHGLCYTSRGALAGTRNSSMGSRYGKEPLSERKPASAASTSWGIYPRDPLYASSHREDSTYHGLLQE